jgi:voltage-gated potassium channel
MTTARERSSLAQAAAERLGFLRRREGERRFARYAAIWAVIVVGIALVGTAGYMVLAGWSVGDALYMTVITLTTTGFREVRELDTIGRIWTGILSIAGVAIIFGTVGLVAESFFAEAVSGRLERRRMADAVDKLSGHFILCGYGRVGVTVARELVHSKMPFVVVDIRPDSIEQAARDGMLVVVGDATHDAVLERAGIKRARGLITTTDSDANNVYVTLSARSLNPDLFIVARANEEASEAKLSQAGADRVVSPYSRAGRQIAEVALRPRVADFLDFALSHGQLSFSIEEFEVVDGGTVAGQTVAALVGRGIHALAIAHGPQEYETNPGPDKRLEAGDHLILSGTAEALDELRSEAEQTARARSTRK